MAWVERTALLNCAAVRGYRRASITNGQRTSWKLEITNPQIGMTLDIGEVGQIEVWGPDVFRRYWKMPEKTVEELRRDGYFITGSAHQNNV